MNTLGSLWVQEVVHSCRGSLSLRASLLHLYGYVGPKRVFGNLHSCCESQIIFDKGESPRGLE